MISDADYAHCLHVLRALCREPESALAEGLAAQVVDQAAALLHVRKSLRRREQRQQDRQRIDGTGIRLRRALPALPAAIDPSAAPQAAPPHAPTAAPPPAPAAPPPGTDRLLRGRRCYICKAHYHRLHSFYDSLCERCAADNYRRREQSGDLRGRVALVTGGRLKIGFAVALKLLRAGATVLITTRFPADARRRYGAEPDHDRWATRLHIHGLDLRHLPSIQAFSDDVAARVPHLDILINNAAQTIRRPPAYYRHLLAGEGALQQGALPAATETVAVPGAPAALGAPAVPAAPGTPQPPLCALLSQRPLAPGDDDDGPFPLGALDRDGQQADLRPANSWTLLQHQVPPVELLEVHAINSIAPFLLMQRMRPLLLRSPHRHRFIINVSSMEGAFSGRYKSPRHPHTNMAKAALNMLTHTCAGELAGHDIYLNSVDTGWVTNEFPADLARRMDAAGFAPPLDEIDGAARICDPIFSGLASGAPVYGCFLKDYRAIEW